MPKKINVEEIKWKLTNEHPVFKTGMPADTVLQIAKRSYREPIAPPLEAGKDANGKIVIWFYQDAKLTLKHVDKMYRITKIEIPTKVIK